MSKHFAIAQGEDDFALVPITPMGQSLAAQCRYHGDDLRYPTIAGAAEAAEQMDFAIWTRQGVPWPIFQREGGVKTCRKL